MKTKEKQEETKKNLDYNFSFSRYGQGDKKYNRQSLL